MREGGVFHPFPRVAIGAVSLPLGAFSTCLLWSLFFDFEDTTGTHCEVDEFAPSISAVIGKNVPQKYIWNICIALHVAPRFLFAYMYKNLFQERLTAGSWTPALVKINFILNVSENFSLLGLSFVSSSEVFIAHAVFFSTFIITFLVSMGLVTGYLLPFCGFQIKNREERESYSRKKLLMKMTYGCAVCACYFYYRHNEHCEPYVYSFFGIFEYMVILCNMAYHVLAYKDFADYVVIVGPNMILVR